jgi:hypothetical protein
MATTTPNYGWDVPTSTDYVKDGATAIETLGDDIDATLYTALGGSYPGLRLIKTQTIGTGVSSVTVNDAFSATYDNYKIQVSGGASSAVTTTRLTLGASATGYFAARTGVTYSTGAASVASDNNAIHWSVSGVALQGANGINGDFDLNSPFLAKYTGFYSMDMRDAVGQVNIGIHKVASSFTSFTLTPLTGTMTGGTIYVYGYGAS